MSDIQRWIADADVGIVRRLENGNYEFLPHETEVVTYADHVAAVAAARAPKWEDCDATGEDFTDAWGRVWVRKDWHVATVAAAEQRAGEEAHGHYMDGYNTAWSLSAAEIERQVREEEQVAQSLAVAESFAAGVKAARDAVAALPWKVAVSFGPIDCDRSCEHGPCVCSGVMRPEAWLTGPADALAAIDGVTP